MNDNDDTNKLNNDIIYDDESRIKNSLSKMNDGILFTRNIILRGMSVIYLAAFVAFYYQSQGLFGNNGILPARIQIEGGSTNSNTIAVMHKKPSLLHLAQYIGLNTEYMIDFIALLGITFSFAGFITQKLCILPTFAALWSLYFSLIQISQVFINQSDLLLLETGFTVLLLAPLNSIKRSNSTDKIALVLLRWLLLRFLFASGEVKFASHCSYWWSFTGLQQHFLTLPLPTPFAWYAYNQPESWSKFGNIFANITELVCCWFFFFPHQTIRRYVFYWQIYLQFWIILTGNYGFLNFLVPVLLLSVLDDSFFNEKNLIGRIYFMAKLLITMSISFVAICYFTAEYFKDFKFNDTYLDLLKSTIKPAPIMAIIIIIVTFFQNLTTHPAIIYTKTFIQKLYAVNTLIAFTIVSIVIIIISMVPHGNLDRSTNISNSELGNLYRQIKNYYIINEYGQHLRTMRSQRLEINYLYAEDIDGPWTEYTFLYKPWDSQKTLPFAGPYFARFDYTFYDASTTKYNDQMWTIVTAYRLLQNNENVLRLFGITNPIHPPPKYVRADLFQFKYTKSFNGSAYWRRVSRGNYLPAFSIDNPTLLSYLKSIKISPNYKQPIVKNNLLKLILDFIRKISHQFEGSVLLFSILSAGFIINLRKK